MAAVREIQTVREAAARVGCRVVAMGVGPDGHARGRVQCADGWHAARFLLALCVVDARSGWARDTAARMRASAPADWALVAYVHAIIRGRIRFEKEKGEIFAGPAFTWNAGMGDCDDHARLVYAILGAAGVPVRLAFLYRPGDEQTGPSHVLVQARYDGAWHWLETTIAAEVGEAPYDAARRLGISTKRTDIASKVHFMSESDMPPVPTGFNARTTPEQLAKDVRALIELGYLGTAAGIEAPDDPRFRVAVLGAQKALGQVADGQIGTHTRAAIAGVLPWYRATIGDVGTTRTRGIDVSAAQGPNVDFEQVKAAGFAFVVVKLTDGIGRDRDGIANVENARAAGLAVFAYHFTCYHNDPADEARAFLDAIAAAGGVDGVALDFECVDSHTNRSPKSPRDTCAWAVAFVRAVKAERSGPVLLYTYPSYGLEMGGELSASGLTSETLLWIADYSKGVTPPDDAEPRVFDPDDAFFWKDGWSTWAMWQTHGNDEPGAAIGSARAPRVPGVPAAVDHNVLNGSLPEVEAGAPPEIAGGVSTAGVLVLAAGAAALAWWALRA